MKTMRKVMTAVLALAMAVSMLVMTGCSTPAVAMVVDGVEYTTGEYLANLYSNFSTAYYESGLYQYTNYGMDPWEQTVPYGEEGEEVDMGLSEYIIQQTKDSMVRQKAVKDMMKEFGIEITEEDTKEFDEQMKTYKESEMLAYGFNKEHYRSMYIATQMEEQKLFYTLYGKDGDRAVPEKDVRQFFDDNYVAFKSIALGHTDAEGNALSDADIAANKKTLEGYLAQFNKSKDMDAVIAQYNKDTATEETAEAAEETEADNTQMLDTVTGDKKLVEAVQTVEVGKAKIVEYTDSNDATYTALIYRMDVEKAGGETYFDDQYDTCLYGLKYEEFDKEVKEAADKLPVEYNERAIRMCDPHNFETDAE